MSLQQTLLFLGAIWHSQFIFRFAGTDSSTEIWKIWMCKNDLSEYFAMAKLSQIQLNA